MEVKQQSQHKSRYTTLIHVAEIINRIDKATREAGVASAADHIHVEIKTQEGTNNSETQIHDNAINVGTNMAH